MRFIIQTNKDKQSLINYLKELESDYIVDVKKKRNTRSNVQNNYYWACIVQPLSEDLGYFPNEIHDILRAKFLNEWEMIEINDNKIGLNKIKSTTALNTKEFELYAEQIRIWALSELNIRLMLPNEYQ
jgi:hypothetical protein|tara:strand:- start:23731 stop:24114 length:384 start_codon:yes stop_codon:yes gene_type:complete